MSGARWMRGARAVRLLVWIAALTPWLCSERPLLQLADGRLSAPASAAAGAGGFATALLWLLLIAIDLLRSVQRRAPRALLLAGLLWFAVPICFQRLSLPLPTDARFAIAAPIAHSPDRADWELLARPETTLPAGPSARHWLGTDSAGRDLLARLLHGMRASLEIGLCAAAIALSIGLVVGLACGTVRGAVDFLLMRAIETLLCFPYLFLVLVVFTFLPRGRGTLIALLGLVSWTAIARLVRGEFLRLADEDFVLAARALGATRWQVAWRHLLPNALAPVWPATTFAVAGALLAEFARSWLGYGIPEPHASLGALLADGQRQLARGDAWLTVVPSTAIVAIVLSFHAWGERLREAMTPEASARPALELR